MKGNCSRAHGMPAQMLRGPWLFPLLSVGSGACLLCLACFFSTLGQHRRDAHGVTAPAQQRTATTESTAVSQADFDKLAASASAARDSDKLDEAVSLYRKALSLRPQW